MVQQKGIFRTFYSTFFCVTVYKYQGADIKEPYNIYMMLTVWIRNNCILLYLEPLN